MPAAVIETSYRGSVDVTVASDGVVQIVGSTPTVDVVSPTNTAIVEIAGLTGPQGIPGLNGSPGAPGTNGTNGVNPAQIGYTIEGTAVVVAGNLPKAMSTAFTITSLRMVCGTAPTGASLILDIKVNGTSLYPTNPSNRPTITSGNTDSGVLNLPDTVTIAAGAKITIDVLQIGSTVAGANITLTIQGLLA